MEINKSEGYSRFISEICLFYSKFESTKGKVNKIKGSFKKVVEQELPLRDNTSLFIIRDFINSENLNMELKHRNIWCKIDGRKLLVGTSAPNWRRGWKSTSKDEFISQEIEKFFYLSNQYIFRAYQINLIMSILLTYNRVCDFRGSITQFVLPICNIEYNKFISGMKETYGRVKTIKHFLNIVNSLDPYVNKANYYFVRATNLYNCNYFEEAVTNLDNTIDTIIQFIKDRKRLPTLSRNQMLGKLSSELGVQSSTLKSIEMLYLLRCRFSSHPAKSKWWDFAEIYDDDIEVMFESVRYILVKFYEYETKNRLVNPEPEKWSEWFMSNANILFDAVWFHKLPES